ncbi:MAG: type II toxin-antitoxin system RelE/ParE family toxin [Bryobacterales bacterium]|nr:type II toxin-antitoxin system RelE/ParE family toxin [Bryobacterales bacterium]
MEFRVEITPRAQSDLNDLHEHIIGQAPIAGAKWLRRLERAVLTLAVFPERCVVEPALCSPTRTVRKLLFGRKRHVYRIYFEVRGRTVHILHIRHGARHDPENV